jgi:hypothetical protein
MKLVDRYFNSFILGHIYKLYPAGFKYIYAYYPAGFSVILFFFFKYIYKLYPAGSTYTPSITLRVSVLILTSSSLGHVDGGFKPLTSAGDTLSDSTSEITIGI